MPITHCSWWKSVINALIKDLRFEIGSIPTPRFRTELEGRVRSLRIAKTRRKSCGWPPPVVQVLQINFRLNIFFFLFPVKLPGTVHSINVPLVTGCPVLSVLPRGDCVCSESILCPRNSSCPRFSRRGKSVMFGNPRVSSRRHGGNPGYPGLAGKEKWEGGKRDVLRTGWLVERGGGRGIRER